MKNQDPERDKRRTNVHLKTEVKENLFKIQVSLFSKGIHLTKLDSYFGVVGKCWSTLICKIQVITPPPPTPPHASLNLYNIEIPKYIFCICFLHIPEIPRKEEGENLELSPPCVVIGRRNKYCWGFPRASLEWNWRTAWRLTAGAPLSHTDHCTCCPAHFPSFALQGIFACTFVTCFQEGEEQVSTFTWEACWTCVWQQQTFHCTSHRNTQSPLPV